MIFKTPTLIAAAALCAATSASASTIVYQDTFDKDGAATNTGIGGGIATAIANSATAHTDTGGVLSASTNGGPQQSLAWSENQFSLKDGFELDVTFNTVAAGNPSFNYSFGIVDEVVFENLKGFIIEDEPNNFVGYGAVLRPNHSTGKPSGLYTDFGTVTKVSNNLVAGLGVSDQTFKLVVNADGSGSATLATTTETYAAGTFSGLFDGSTDGKYHFMVYAQGNNDPGSALQSVKITAVPEPGSLALLGLGGLLITRRRRG